ncbi:MAG TPA: META domain-containing protein [Brumimicrobium sp.]|nr:META domain-containing protein [Brumimicrobium sp.]
MKFITLFILTSLLIISAGCSNSKEVETNNEKKMENQAQPSEVKHPSPAAVDFYANADDNSWKLSVRFGGEIVFTDTKNNIQFYSDVNEKTVAQGANVIQLSSINETQVIHVNIDIVDCMKSGKKVDIMIRNIGDQKSFDYSGCGFYRGTPQLHDIWALHKLNGKELSAKQFPRELPHFEFDLVTQQMSGFAGCNQVNGNLKFEYNKMIIDNLVSTRMYCGEASDLENEILKILRNEPIYHLKDLHLTLETPNGSVILKKVD